MMGKKSKILILVVCVLVLVPLSFLGYFYLKVTREASSRIERGAIDRIIASESPVYYDDGHTPIGVFFEKTSIVIPFGIFIRPPFMSFGVL